MITLLSVKIVTCFEELLIGNVHLKMNVPNNVQTFLWIQIIKSYCSYIYLFILFWNTNFGKLERSKVLEHDLSSYDQESHF